MALIKFGPNVAQLSGTVGGTVYSHNRYGSYARTWKKPTNPNTPGQSGARARLTNASQAWRLLTGPQRTAWENYAANTPLKNKLGETIYVSGQAMYTRSNAFGAQMAGWAALAAAPVLMGEAAQPNLEPGSIALSAAAEHITIAPGYAAGWADLNLITAAANEILLVQVSPPISAGLTFYAGPWLTALTPQADYISGLANPDDPIVLDKVALVAGEIRFVRMRQMDGTGRLSPWGQSGPLTVGA